MQPMWPYKAVYRMPASFPCYNASALVISM